MDYSLLHKIPKLSHLREGHTAERHHSSRHDISRAVNLLPKPEESAYTAHHSDKRQEQGNKYQYLFHIL